jgi:hypothetical protein
MIDDLIDTRTTTTNGQIREEVARLSALVDLLHGSRPVVGAHRYRGTGRGTCTDGSVEEPSPGAVQFARL